MTGTYDPRTDNPDAFEAQFEQEVTIGPDPWYTDPGSVALVLIAFIIVGAVGGLLAGAILR